MTRNSHRIIEKDVAFVEFTLDYDTDSKMLKHTETDVGDSLSSYDAEVRCTCGEDFDTFEAAREHAAENATDS